MPGAPNCLAELRSVALQAAIGERLRADPGLIEQARRGLRSASRILEEPVDRLVAFLREDSERARELRQCTPFAGVIASTERWRIWRAVRESA